MGWIHGDDEKSWAQGGRRPSILDDKVYQAKQVLASVCTDKAIIAQAEAMTDADLILGLADSVRRGEPWDGKGIAERNRLAALAEEAAREAAFAALPLIEEGDARKVEFLLNYERGTTEVISAGKLAKRNPGKWRDAGSGVKGSASGYVHPWVKK